MEPIDQYEQDIHHEITKVIPDEDIKQEAKEVFSDFIAQETAWSRPREHFAIASVYFVVRKNNLPYTIRDFTDEEPNKINSAFRRMCSDLETVPPPQDPPVFVDRIHNNLSQVDERVATRAKEILSQTSPEVKSGKQPNTLAASAYYIAANREGVKITQDLIANASNVSNATIRNCYQEIVKDIA